MFQTRNESRSLSNCVLISSLCKPAKTKNNYKQSKPSKRCSARHLMLFWFLDKFSGSMHLLYPNMVKAMITFAGNRDRPCLCIPISHSRCSLVDLIASKPQTGARYRKSLTILIYADWYF